jgi:hypothetical protein
MLWSAWGLYTIAVQGNWHYHSWWRMNCYFGCNSCCICCLSIASALGGTRRDSCCAYTNTAHEERASAARALRAASTGVTWQYIALASLVITSCQLKAQGLLLVLVEDDALLEGLRVCAHGVSSNGSSVCVSIVVFWFGLRSGKVGLVGVVFLVFGFALPAFYLQF